MMLKIVTILGARPQFIKAAAVSRCIRQLSQDKIREVIVHTGQHYDYAMSEVFFEELQIPKPDFNLEVGSLSHGKQTGMMTERIEEVLVSENPEAVVVYGDTNSTLAGALAAAKLRIPVIHIEAGLRSFNKSMPEEINRIAADHVSTLLFTPTMTGYRNLLREGFPETHQGPYHADHPGIFHCGDVMYDNSMFFLRMAEQKSTILQDQNLVENGYILGTIHRDHNTDIPKRLHDIFSTSLAIAEKHHLPFVIPLHPRTLKAMKENFRDKEYEAITSHPMIRLLPPASYLDMIMLEKNARLVMTDSGGVQKESYFFGKPCIILRSETEWTEIVDQGCGRLTDVDPARMQDAFTYYLSDIHLDFPAIFGDGQAADFICRKIIETLGGTNA